MESIKVKKEELLNVLRENRTKHRHIFEEAIEGYRKTVIAEFERRLDDAKAGRKIDIRFTLPQPVDQTKDYDRAIGMLEMTIDDVIHLEEIEYRQYVMDDWSWKQSFLTSNSTYSGTAAAFLAQ